MPKVVASGAKRGREILRRTAGRDQAGSGRIKEGTRKELSVNLVLTAQWVNTMRLWAEEAK